MLLAAALALLALAALESTIPEDRAAVRPQDTEQASPEPAIVVPGAYAPAQPPSDAVVLFGGTDLSQWVSAKGAGPARWTVADGVVTVAKGTGGIQTQRSFTDYQLHLEWRVPAGIAGSGQARGNSGLFLAATGPDEGYELQILDSFGNRTYVNGQAGAVYKQYPPRANPARRPGEWQSYDVIWTAPRFAADGSLQSPAYVTAFFNGVLVQDHVALRGKTVFIGKPAYKAHGPAPIQLQDHGDPSAPISFRNIWLREL